MDKFADNKNPQVQKRLAEKAAKAKKKAEAAKLAEKDFSKDPLGAYGFGLIAYRGTLGSLVAFFFAVSLIMYGILHDYETGHAINTDTTPTPYGKYSLADLGYSSV
jgi:hypothetical protein